MAGTPLDLGEMIRRSFLQKQLLQQQGGQMSPAAMLPLASPSAPVASPTAITPAVAPAVAAPPNRVQTALDSYRQAQAEPMPSKSDYHPSVGRRIAATIMGALAGMHDPKSGAEVGSGIVNAPYNQKVTDYQNRLSQKRVAYETEQKGAEDEAKTSHLVSQGKAEEARLKAEEATADLRKFQVSPEGFDRQVQLAKVNHPKTAVPVKLNLKNGEKINATRDSAGNYRDPVSDTVIGLDSIESESPLETKAPVTTSHFDANSGKMIEATPGKDPVVRDVPGVTPKVPKSDPYSDWKESLGHKPDNNEIMRFHHPPPDPNMAAFRKQTIEQARVDRQRTVYSKPHAKIVADTDSQLDKVDEALSLVSQKGSIASNIVMPKLLTATLTGKDSGARLTKDELKGALAKAGITDSWDRWKSSMEGKGQLSELDKQQIGVILNDVKERTKKKQAVANDTLDKMGTAESVDEIIEHDRKARKKRTDMETESDAPKITHRWNNALGRMEEVKQ
jgi:hypothetical protein